MLAGHRVFQGIVADEASGPQCLLRIGWRACAGTGALPILVRDHAEVVIADMCGFVHAGGKGFLPNLAMRRVLSR